MRNHVKRVLSNAIREKNLVENELALAYPGTMQEAFLKLQLAFVKLNIGICETLLGK